MYRQTICLAVTCAFVTAAACGSPTAPTSSFSRPVATPPTAAPTPPTTGPPPLAGSLFGTVFVNTPGGAVLLDEVEVYCDSCGPVGHTFLYTDGKGFYRFPDVNGGLTPILITKSGYSVVGATRVFANGTSELRVTVNGDTRFDIELTPR